MMRMGIMCVAVFSVALIIGCGSAEKTLEEAELKIKSFQEKGVPDSMVSDARVYLSQVRSSRKMGNSGIYRKYSDSLKLSIDKAEGFYTESAAKIKPANESLKASLVSQKSQLTGMQLRVADSILAEADSFIQKDWFFQAEQKLSALNSMLPVLLADEQKAQKLKNELIGTWVGARRASDEFSGMEKSRYMFSADGNLQMTEEMKGQTQQNLKEDWLFQSTGTWDVKGDTIFLKVSQEKCVRQTYWYYKIKDGKAQWVRDDKPTYDKEITDKKKDRFMTLDYLKEAHKKVK